MAANFAEFATFITHSRGARCCPVIKKNKFGKRNWTLNVDYILYSLVIVSHHSKGLRCCQNGSTNEKNVASKLPNQIDISMIKEL